MIMELHVLQAELYRGFCNNSDDEVINLCTMTPERSLHYCTIHNSTVLHLACYFRRFELANILFNDLSDNQLSVLIERTNAWGNTILHDASTSNQGLELVKKMLRKVPRLLQVRNRSGETCVFQAIRYGKKIMFEFLTKEVDRFCELHHELFDNLHFFQRDDNITILHMAVLTRNFDMAHMIARKYPNLCKIRAHNQLTALQILAYSPTAFKSGAKLWLLKRFVYSCVSTHEQRTDREIREIQKGCLTYILSTIKSCWKSPLIEEVRKMKRDHEYALNLARILIQLDTSWKYTHEPRAEVTPVTMSAIPIFRDELGEEGTKDETSVGSFYNHHDRNDIEIGETSYSSSMPYSDEAPLLLAARKGCIEVVQEILNVFPQAVNYLNHDQENLLHVAIKNRNLDIFMLVKRGISHFKSLLGAVDSKNNSVMHMVGIPREVLPGTKMRSPVLQLSDDLLLLESLENMSPGYLRNHRNHQLMTADELFAVTNEKLRIEAKEWLKRTAEHCTVVIILIATVAFAAAYTVPGGPNQQTGYPLLLGLPLFLVFTITDVLSLGFALTAVVVFLAILTSSYQLKDFRRSLPQKLLLGFTLLFLSVTMMMVAFAATILLMINNREHWTKIAFYVVAFFPICIFMLSYITLYIQLAETVSYWIKKIGKSLLTLTCTSRPARRTFRNE